MYIHLTRHCKQRRPHHKVIPDNDILPWIRFFIVYFDLKNKENGKYQIRRKGAATVIKKEKSRIIVITFRKFGEFSDASKLKEYTFEPAESGRKTKIYRRNFKGVLKKCGYLYNDCFSLDSDLDKKLNISLPAEVNKIPLNRKNDFIYYDKELHYWILKEFKRKDSIGIFIRKKGHFVPCGYVINETVFPSYRLLVYLKKKKHEIDISYLELVDNIYIVKDVHL